MIARDEMALEMFIGDNFNQSREQSVVDWEWFKKSKPFRIEHYYAMADALIAAGYTKP